MKHYYGFYVPPDQRTSSNIGGLLDQGQSDPETEQQCFKIPPTHPTADSQGPFGSEPNKAQMVREPYMSPSDVSFPTAPT